MEQHHSNHRENQIEVNVSYLNNLIRLSLKDDEGKAPVLGLTHGKLIHLIIVSEDLTEFHHLHPVQKDDQSFEKEFALTGNAYKAFVDINPIGKDYSIEPISVL